MSLGYYGIRNRNEPVEESIYNLIPKEKQKIQKPPRHASKFKPMVKDELKANRKENKTMGPAKVPLNEPEQFLKKHSKEPQLEDTKPFKYPDEDRRRPAVPKHSEKPLMGVKSDKNYITTNAVENIVSVPKKPAANFADTKHGAIHPLEDSGLTPKYVNKKNYGRTPHYLSRRKEEVAAAQAEYDEYVRDSMKRGAMKELSVPERESIIAGLKSNWEEIHHQYQGLSVVTDTAPKKNRKERMEAEMNQLEKDIELLEKHTRIYIANPAIQAY